MHRNDIMEALLLAIGIGSTAHASNVTWFTPTDPVNSYTTWTGTGYTQNFGVAFTTGSAGGFKISWIDLGLNTYTNTSGTVSLKVALHNTTNSTAYSAVAGSTAYATDTITISGMPTTQANYFTANITSAQLPNISAYAMSANTSYALILYDAGNVGISRRTGYAANTSNNFYTTSNGFAALDTFRNNTANYSPSGGATLAISFGATASAVPGSGAIALVAVPGLLGFRRRRH